MLSTKPRHLSEVLHFLFETGFITFCGAGVSIPPPSCSPSWWTLTEEILTAFFQMVPEEWGLPTDLILKDPNRQPEEVFENFANVLDTRLYQVFEVLNVTAPNATHLILAKLAKAGILKACFTTNFDEYFERALEREGVDFEVLVDNAQYDAYFTHYLKPGGGGQKTGHKFLLCKVHGTTARPDTIVSVASAYKTAKGFSAPKAALFSALLATYPCLFLGYSGWDFTHLNYLRFWERVGPQVKQIVWNRRPNETGGPDFKEIFRTCYEKFGFCEAELPNDLVASVQQQTVTDIAVGDLPLDFQASSEALFERAREERLKFFEMWAQKIPEAHALGLVITEGRSFSERFQQLQQALKEQTSETEAMTFNFTEVIQELSEQLSRQEISVEEYQAKMNEMQVEQQLKRIKTRDKPIVLAILQENRYPGITDNDTYLVTYVSTIGTLTRWFGPEEAAALAADYLPKIMALATRTDREGQADHYILNQTMTLLHPDEDLWKPAIEQMKEEKEKFVTEEIDYETFMANCLVIQQRALNRQMGMDLDFDPLLDKQIEAVMNSVTDAEFVEQCEALSLTVMTMAITLFSTLPSSTEYQDLLLAVQGSPAAKDVLAGKDLDLGAIIPAFDRLLRTPFLPVLERADQVTGYAKNLLEMALLSLWISRTQWLDPQRMEAYQKQWDTGEYPQRVSHPEICAYLRKWVDTWLNDALETLPTRFVQRLCSDLVIFAEMSNDFDLCRRATLKSLELSEGQVTEATPNGIPGSLAGFYERQGDLEKALHYYEMNLDAIKLYIPPTWGDVIVYRAAFLNAQKGKKRKALEIIGRLHPDFYGNAGVLNMPARKLTRQLADELAGELGYRDTLSAVTHILEP